MTDAPTTTIEVADTAAGPGDTYVPPMLLFVFGLPIFVTLIWFFLRFTAPDRFGRVDRSLIDDLDRPDDDEDPTAQPTDPESSDKE